MKTKLTCAAVAVLFLAGCTLPKNGAVDSAGNVTNESNDAREGAAVAWRGEAFASLHLLMLTHDDGAAVGVRLVALEGPAPHDLEQGRVTWEDGEVLEGLWAQAWIGQGGREAEAEGVVAWRFNESGVGVALLNATDIDATKGLILVQGLCGLMCWWEADFGNRTWVEKDFTPPPPRALLPGENATETWREDLEDLPRVRTIPTDADGVASVRIALGALEVTRPART